MVECAYPSNSAATGFQVIAQQIISSKVHKIYASKTSNCQTVASVLVEENGLYQVTIFAIRGGRGIVDSTVEYSGLLTVDLNLAIDMDTTKHTSSTPVHSTVVPVGNVNHLVVISKHNTLVVT